MLKQMHGFNSAQSIMVSMPVLYFLADTFINTFGITQPSEKTRKQAAFFILTLGVLVLIAVSIAGYAIYLAMR